MKKLFALFGATSLVCSAQITSAAPVWIYNTKVQIIYATSGVSTGYVLAFSTDHAYCSSPQTPNYHYIQVGQNGVTEASAKNMFAVAMLAMSLDKEVAVLFDDATAYCWVSAIQVKN